VSTDRAHALYRFYADDGALLYVGITLDPGARWRAHRDDKPWWHEVASVTVESHSSRETVLAAERTAIMSEKPRYNVVHNRGGTPEAPRLSPQLDRLLPFQAGDWVALGLADGRCPVGEIAAYDDTWVSVRLKSFWDGTITGHTIAVRWQEVVRVELAYPENALTDPDQAPDWRIRGSVRDAVANGGRYMDDLHLGQFQTAWQQVHLPPDGDPVQEALREVRVRREERL
jgi:predicted GIY-YIG superfamily endonuclease